MEAKQAEERRGGMQGREKGNHNHFPLSPINVYKWYRSADKHRRQEDVAGTYMRILCRTCLGQELWWRGGGGGQGGGKRGDRKGGWEKKRKRERERGWWAGSYTAGVIKATQCSQQPVAASETAKRPSFAFNVLLQTSKRKLSQTVHRGGREGGGGGVEDSVTNTRWNPSLWKCTAVQSGNWLWLAIASFLFLQPGSCFHPLCDSLASLSTERHRKREGGASKVRSERQKTRELPLQPL